MENTPVENLSVPKSFLDDLKNEIDNLKKDRDLLMSVADKKSMAMYYQRHATKLPKEVRVRTMLTENKGKTEQKVIVGWRSIQDEVYKNPLNGVWVEKQVVEVLFDDGTKAQMNLTDFNRQYTSVNCRLIGKVSDEETGDEAFKLQRIDTGEEILINSKFVN